jgi:hypothetical protein
MDKTEKAFILAAVSAAGNDGTLILWSLRGWWIPDPPEYLLAVRKREKHVRDNETNIETNIETKRTDRRAVEGHRDR